MAAVASALLGKVCFHAQLVLCAGEAPGAAKGMWLLLRDGLVGAGEVAASGVTYIHIREGKEWRKDQQDGRSRF